MRFAMRFATCLTAVLCLSLPAKAQFREAVWDTITADTLRDALTPQAIGVNGYEQFHLTYSKQRDDGSGSVFYRFFDLLTGMGPETVIDSTRACYRPVVASRFSDNDYNIDILFESDFDIFKCSSLSPFGPWECEAVSDTADPNISPSIAWGYNFLHGAWITYINSQYKIVYMRTGGGQPRIIDVIEGSELGQFGAGAQPYIIAVDELPHIFYRGVSGPNYRIHHAFKVHADSDWTIEPVFTPNADDYWTSATSNGINQIMLAISGNEGFGFPARVYYTYKDPVSGEWSVPELVTGQYSATNGSIISRPGWINYVASCGLNGDFFDGNIYLSSDSSGSFETSLLASYPYCTQPVLADITGEYAVLIFDAPIGGSQSRNIEIVYLGPNLTNSVHEAPIPSILGFSRSYPNPFNSRVNIEFGLESPAPVQVEIFDILGRRIETLVRSNFPSGEHHLIWNAADRSSGVYFYRLRAADQSRTGKMVLLK